MRLNEFCKFTGLSLKTAHWVYDNLHKKDTFQRDFTMADVEWVLSRKLQNYKGVIKQVPEFSDYYVTDTGIVYNNKRGFLEEQRGYYSKQGYHYVVLNSGNKHLKIKVSRLVALLYIPNPLNKLVVNHIDGNKANDRVSNLEWCTISENTKHAFDTGLAKNDKGFDDSQSLPVAHITLYGDIITVYGSITIAASALNRHKSGIARAAKSNTPRFLNGEKLKSHTETTFIYYTKETQQKLSSSTSISK